MSDKATSVSQVDNKPRCTPTNETRDFHHAVVSQAQQQVNALEHIDSFLKANECNSVIDEVSGSALDYRHLLHNPAKHLWKRALANYMGMLAQGVGTRIKKGTNTIRFIPRHVIPNGRKVIYARLVASLRPHKK